MKKMLRRIRRSANDARDNDVLLERLRDVVTQNSEEMRRDGLRELIRQVAEHREQVQALIVSVYAKTGRKRLAQRAAKLVDSVAWQGGGPEPTFQEFARRRMAAIAAEFFDVATDSGVTACDLHAIRIAGKRLRYAMEIFSAAFCREFRKIHYSCVEQLQKLLGALNDHTAAQARFQRIVGTLPPNAVAANLATLICNEWTAFQQGREAFVTWWSKDRVRELRAGIERTIHMDLNETS
jgi:CHAD domain-containing protein